MSADEQTDFDMGDLKLISACCCTVNGIYCPQVAVEGTVNLDGEKVKKCDWKKCFGGHAKGAMLCLGFETLCCKMQEACEENDNQCCILHDTKCVVKKRFITVSVLPVVFSLYCC